VGGKTAINLGAGKNLAGTFHQPATVLIDPSTLDTLPERELRAGYAEIIKYGLIGDPTFFGWCESEGAALLAGDPEARDHAIETCVRAKAAIVAEDERETKGRRALLNLGHSFGHALETETGFDLLHGEAVAIGMTLAFRFSAERGLCAAADAERVEAHLAAVGLPTQAEGVDAASLAGRMADDKKNRGGRLNLVLVRGIGEAFVQEVELGEVEDFLARQFAG
jgi:3-dehydroquinate synthase